MPAYFVCTMTISDPETYRKYTALTPATVARYLGQSQAEVSRMSRLIDDLLSLSRIELAAHVRPETPVELLPIVRQLGITQLLGKYPYEVSGGENQRAAIARAISEIRSD